MRDLRSRSKKKKKISFGDVSSFIFTATFVFEVVFVA